ncbi:endonuclease/exonuclease/phosphatase family protein [Luteimicrobium sp. DT211]|uniref:endonuclease/exonuclease/phosphatase family protein n=1 Tax=Luteimicrobium sp. DT211 TaxID=3393412 RepID=UPI003CE7B609
MRLATFNILHGRQGPDGEVDLDRFAAAVAGLDADVLALQEVDRDQPRSHGGDLTALAADAMGAVEHRFAATLAGEPGVWTSATGDLQPDTATYGIALLSRVPVRAWHEIRLPEPRRRVPVRFPGHRRPTLVHDEPRAALVARLDAPFGPLTVAATHLSFVPVRNRGQLRRLARELRETEGPLVVMGDLNTAGDRPARATGWVPLVTEPTFPIVGPREQLDHILTGGGLCPAGPGRSVDTGISDHRALVVDVRPC